MSMHAREILEQAQALGVELDLVIREQEPSLTDKVRDLEEQRDHELLQVKSKHDYAVEREEELLQRELQVIDRQEAQSLRQTRDSLIARLEHSFDRDGWVWADTPRSIDDTVADKRRTPKAADKRKLRRRPGDGRVSESGARDTTNSDEYSVSLTDTPYLRQKTAFSTVGTPQKAPPLCGLRNDEIAFDLSEMGES